MKNNKRQFALSLGISFMIIIFSFSAVLAGPLGNTEDMINQGDEFADKAGFDINTDIGDVLSMVVQGFLGFLAIIFIILILLGGYKWMTAQGNEEKVKEAQSLITRAIIGLIIIVAAYAITYFVFNALPAGSGGGNNNSSGGVTNSNPGN